MKWLRKNIIALLALVCSIIAISTDLFDFFENRDELLEIEFLETDNKYWHVYEITKINTNLYVSQVTEWQKIRIGNLSKFPVTITDSYLILDHKTYDNNLKPFFKKVKYGENNVDLHLPLELPFTIEPEEVIEFCMLLNIPIDSFTGMGFYNILFKPENLNEESQMASLLLNKLPFDNSFRDLVSQLGPSEYKRFLNAFMSTTEFAKIVMKRELIVESSNGYELIDKNNDAEDGFVFMNKSSCIFLFNDFLFQNKISVTSSFENIDIYFKTLRNNEYRIMYLWDDFCNWEFFKKENNY